MALEILGPIIEFIGNTALAIQAGKSRGSVPPVSTPVACLSFFFVGIAFALLGFVLVQVIPFFVALVVLAVVVGLALFVAWHAGAALGFQLTIWLAWAYACFFALGASSVFFVATSL